MKISVIIPVYNTQDFLPACVDSLLNQTLEDIELAEKSETRRTIEKFIDENPEAVAALLRNWLNEEWN